MATVGEPFYNPISKVWEFQFLHILTSTYYFPLFLLNSSYPSGFEVIRLVFFICISLVTNDTEHLFMCLLAICASSLKKYLFKSFAHFQLVFIELWVFHIILILDPCQIYDIQIFAPILWVVFSLSYSFLLECKSF